MEFNDVSSSNIDWGKFVNVESSPAFAGKDRCDAVLVKPPT